MPMKMMDGVRPAPQYYVDIRAYEAVYTSRPQSFGIGNFTRLLKRSWVGWNDPVAWYSVVDALCKGASGWSITPEHLRDHLNRDNHTLWFTPQVTGRILSGVYTMFYQTLVDHHKQSIMPFEKYTVGSRKLYYCMDGPESVKVYGEEAGRILLMALRRKLLSVGRAQMRAESEGKFYTYPDIEARLFLDPEDMTWKERKFRLTRGKPPALRTHKR
jgi:hypothetical protein